MAEWTAVTPGAPCEICGRDRWCSRNGSALRCTKESSHPTYGQGIRHTDKGGNDWWLFRNGSDDRSGNTKPLPTPTVEQTHQETLASADTLHAVYSALLAELALSTSHHTALTRRGLSPQQAADFRDRLMYRSLELRGRAATVAKLIEAGHEKHLPRVPGFIQKTGKDGARYWTLSGSPGLVIPVRDTQGRIVGLKIRRDDTTRGKYQWMTSRKNRDGKVCGVGPGAPVHVPLSNDIPTPKATKPDIRVTEGPLKADVATVLTGTPTIALPGVGSWKRVASVATSLDAKAVTIALDADSHRNNDVARALEGLAADLPSKGFDIRIERWDEADGKGIDDLLLAGKIPEVIEGQDLYRWVGDIAEQADRSAHGDIGDRVEVLVTADEHEVVQGALSGLAAADDIFHRSCRLVHVVTESAEHSGITRSNTPHIRQLPVAYLREKLAQTCFFYVDTDDGRAQKSPPRACVDAIHQRGHWPGIRQLEGVTTSPTLRPDGSILNEPGYDAATGVLYLPNGDPPTIPESPTRDDAVAAAEETLARRRGFPVREAGTRCGLARFTAHSQSPGLRSLVRLRCSSSTPTCEGLESRCWRTSLA